MSLLVIDAATVQRLVSPAECIAVTEAALRKTSDGRVHQDIRRTLALPGADGTCLSLMYAAIDDLPLFGAKVQSVFPSNFDHGKPSHQGGVMLFEKDHGRPTALIDASAITSLRTPAASAVATRALSHEDARELALIGYGDQAERHIEMISLVRPISHIRVWGRDPVKANAFAARQRNLGRRADALPSAKEAVAGADIVCTVTSARTPVLMGEWLSPGTHINAVGASVPSLQEIDLECVIRSSIWVDYMAMTLVAASDIFGPLAKGLVQIAGELGAVLSGALPGRANADEITLYRSLGVPAQDIALANLVYEKARATGLGTDISL
ncbi:ornithine cyclodeaminase family protein [Dongia sp.]|uniref:ornithine cyclodeaminase family protein n=1 Tax=Dongia sp. TaxID=1977262 RepID=UPI0035AEBAE5